MVSHRIARSRMTGTPLVLLAWGLVAFAVGAASAPAAEASQVEQAPAALRAWLPWVVRDVPDAGCPWVGSARVCVWPGQLELSPEASAATFRIRVVADAEAMLTLPGSRTYWPSEVRRNGVPVATHAREGRPAVTLPAGVHTLTGTLAWSRMPDSLPVPPEIALVRVRRPTGELESPQRERDGSIRLRERTADPRSPTETATVTLDVVRLLVDDIPIRLETRVRLRVSGDPRELDLGRVLPEGFVPTAVDGPIPARLDPDGGLQVQLRPGDWTLVLQARTEDDRVRFARVAGAPPWPSLETWALDTSPNRRSVEVRGAPGVDPRQTALPMEWHGFPAYMLSGESALELAVLSRGAEAPAAESVRLRRDMRLTSDGSALLIRDHLSGERSQGRRLEIVAPSELGRVVLDGTDVLITRLPDGGQPGVELRHDRWQAQADLVHPKPRQMPAIGWDVDVQHLSATLHLPPGWQLVAVAGADRAPTAWLQRWGLIDLFLLLLIVIGLRATHGTPLALLALAVLGVGWHTEQLPQQLWLVMIATAAIATALRGRRWGRWAMGLHYVILFLLALAAVVFVWEETRVAFFPQLANAGAGPDGFVHSPGRARSVLMSTAVDRASSPEAAVDYAFAEDSEGMPTSLRSRSALSLAEPGRSAPEPMVDPSAVVQTGPGIPTWQWESHPLTWSGPVSREQKLRVWVLGPAAVGGIRLATVLGLLMLLGLVIRRTLQHGSPRGGAGRTEEEPMDSDARPTGGPSGAASASQGDPGGSPPTAGSRKDVPASGESSGDSPPESDGGAGEAPSISGESAGGSPPRGAGASPGMLLLGIGALGGLLAYAPPVAAESGSGFPPPNLLQELRAAALERPVCGERCVETAALHLDARDGQLILRATVHAQSDGAWVMPGPANAWRPTEVRVDGVSSDAMRLEENGHVVLRVEAGVREVVLRGPLGDRLTLAFGQPVRILTWSAEGWLVDGARPDAPPPESVHLTREASAPEPGERREGDVQEGSDLPPALRLERRVDVGVTWSGTWALHRAAGSAQGVRARVPLLPGERVVSDGVIEEDGHAVVVLERGESVVRWRTTLDPVDEIVLQARSGDPWTETWTLACGVVWHCAHEGLTPVALTGQDGERLIWQPRWMPWPGESVTWRFTRPTGVEGQTITVDRVVLAVTAGRRLRTTLIEADVRTSRGGRWTVHVPPEAEIQRVVLSGRELPAMHEGGEIALTLPVGGAQVLIELREPMPTGWVARSPKVSLEGGATDVRITWTPAASRWLLWTSGPRWGPVVTLWHWLPVLLIVAFVLGRWAPTPLGTLSWLLLGLGMTQVEWTAPLMVVLWLLALGWRARGSSLTPGTHNLMQIGLVVLTLFALSALVSAVLQGLALRPPDMQVAGGGSWAEQLRWYADRTDGPLPTVSVVTLPLWVWHVAMLAWALWLAASLVRWLRWGWGAFVEGGGWRKVPAGPPPPHGPGGSAPAAPTAAPRPADAQASAEGPPQESAGPPGDGFRPPGRR